MRRLRLIGVGIAAAVFAMVVVLIGLAVLTARSGDPALWPSAAGEPRVEIFVVSHGYHSGLVLPRETLAQAAGRRGDAALATVSQRFAGFHWLEIGWGDEGFYRHVPDAASLTVGLTIRALFRPGNPSVVHVVGLPGHPREAFPSADLVRIELSSRGWARILDGLEASFNKGEGAAALEPLGPGLYGPSLFYRATGAFHIFNVCNHWVARLLSAAGVPTAPVLATLPSGLFLDLQWRTGLAAVQKN
jgi:uncharacterized protein (TIGR02117 family)